MSTPGTDKTLLGDVSGSAECQVDERQVDERLGDKRQGGEWQVSVTVADLRESASSAARQSSQLLFGERLQLLQQAGHWLHVRNLRDDYCGFVDAASVTPIPVDDRRPADYWVAVRASLLFADADIKSPLLCRLPFGAELSVVGCDDERFFRVIYAGGEGYVWRDHLLAIGETLPMNPVQVAEQHFMAAPYLWGGRSPDGIDCSGLVQMLAYAVGIRLPRDSHQQESVLPLCGGPESVEGPMEGSVERPVDGLAEGAIEATMDRIQHKSTEIAAAGDLVFWPGHVGIIQRTGFLLHATAHSMTCCVEPLQHVIDRAGPISSVRQLPAVSEPGAGQMGLLDHP